MAAYVVVEIETYDPEFLAGRCRQCRCPQTEDARSKLAANEE